MRTKYSFLILMPVISFERNDHMAMLLLKLGSFSPLKSLFEVNLIQMTKNLLVFRSVWPARRSRRQPLSLQSPRKGETCSETARWILGEKSSCLVQLILSSKVSIWFTKGNSLQQRNSWALTEGNLRRTQCEGMKCYSNRNEHSYP